VFWLKLQDEEIKMIVSRGQDNLDPEEILVKEKEAYQIGVLGNIPIQVANIREHYKLTPCTYEKGIFVTVCFKGE
jgi:hypothetical protein